MSEVALEGGQVDAPVVAPEPVAPVAPVAPEPVAPAAEPTPAAPTIDYDDPRLNDLIQTQAAQIAQQQLEQMVQRAQAQQPQGQQQGFDVSQLMDEYGNVNPAALAQMIEHNRQSTLEAVKEMFTPIATQMQQAQEAEVIASGEARLEDILADDIARNGEFASDPEADRIARERVRATADALFPEIAQRYGATPRAAEIAMERAADMERTYIRTLRAQAVEQHTNQMATLAGQHGEPGGTGAVGAVSRPVVKFGERVTDRYAAGGAPIQ